MTDLPLLEIAVVILVLVAVWYVWDRFTINSRWYVNSSWHAETKGLPDYLRYVGTDEFPDTYCIECGKRLVTFKKAKHPVVFCFDCQQGRER